MVRSNSRKKSRKMFDNTLMAIEEVSIEMGVSPNTVKLYMDQWAQSGGRVGLPWIRLPNAKTRKIRRSSMVKFLDDLEAESASA